jgi:hypothetical protein
MPKVTFVNEHRTVEVAKGRLISDIATELGIATCRAAFAGTQIGSHTVWVKGAVDAVSPPGFFERWFSGNKGWRRQANRARILGDVEIWTQSTANRLRSPRPVSPPPRPATDESAPRLPIDASGSAAFPYGNPLAVGTGEREAKGRSTAKVKAAGAKGAKAAEAEADGDEESEESEES